jgi:hypothetical protein
MKNHIKKIILLLMAMITAATTFAQQLQDVVYLTNGSVIRGTLIEQVPKVKIRTSDGSLWVFDNNEIDKITSEPAVQNNNNNVQIQQYSDPVNEWTARQSKPKSNYTDLSTGFRIFADLSIMSQTSYYTCSAISYSGTFGHQFNPKLYIGAGIAAQVYFDYWYYTNRADDAPELYAQMPLFAEARYDVLATKCSPFVSLRAGYALGIDEYNDYSGLYLNPSVGIRYKSLNFSVGLDLVKLKDPWYFDELLINLEHRYTTVNWQSSVMFKIAYEWGGRR